MQKNLWNQLAEYIKNNRFRSAWKKVVLVLACVVVFCTTYALILPAITMEQKSFCGQEEHVHTQKCYQEIPVASELICPLVEGEVISSVSDGDGDVSLQSVSDGDASVVSGEVLQIHTHTEDCYAVPKEPSLTCKLAESEEHTHTFLCYGKWELVCEKEEHAHSLACFSDPQADVESETVWENMVWNLDLTGYRVEDVVTIAKSQLGYTESTRNYKVNEDTTVNGYTRYGAWSEDPYGDWDAMFASFCLHYAEVEGMPLGTDADSWVQELVEAKLYYPAVEGKPQPGNLLFADEDLDGMADHVAIVSEYIAQTEEAAAQIKTIQGDVANQVQYVTYEVNDGKVLGYGIPPKQPEPVLTYTYSDETVQVEVELPKGSSVPEDAVLVVNPIVAESEGYDQLLNEAEAAIDGMVEQIQFYDISFYTSEQEYIPVSDRAQVVMRFKENVVDPTANTVVLHYEEIQDTPVVLDDVNVAEETSVIAAELEVSSPIMAVLQETPIEITNTVVSFATEGFSVFAVVEVETGIYNAQILSNMTGIYHQLNSGKTYMIITPSDTNQSDSVDTRIALKAEVENAGQLKGLEVVNANGMVTSNADDSLLWRFLQVNGSSNEGFTIQSVSTGKYLSISNGALVLSDTPYEFTSKYINENGAARLTDANATEGDCVAFINNVFKVTNFADIEHNGLILAEYTTNSSAVEYVTNLDGQIAMIVAVNNGTHTQDNQTYYYPAKALSSVAYIDSNREHALLATVMETGSENGKIVIQGQDSDNNLAWEFEAVAGEPGSYYIKVANVYGTDNPNVGKYIYFYNEDNGDTRIRDLRLVDVSQRQKIEVVKGVVEGDYPVNEVVCLRTNINGSYYYLQLGQNNSGWPIYNSDQHYYSVGDNCNTTSFAGNHFVIAELSDSDPDGKVVNEFNDKIDQLPSSMEEFNSKVANKGSFAEQVAYRNELRKIAMELQAQVDSLTSMQKNFIGEKRLEKLESLEWLWRAAPNVVEGVELDATVKMFNYDTTVNENYQLGQDAHFVFYSYDDNEKTVNGYKQPDFGDSLAPEMVGTLSSKGYPVIKSVTERTYEEVNNNGESGWEIVDTEVVVEDGELDYLFDGTYQKGATMTNGGGLFRQDSEGYYYYYSDTNAAWYDQENSRFVLYDVVVRPEYTLDREELSNEANGNTELVNEMVSNFLPFNEVVSSEAGSVGNIIYDDETATSSVDGSKVQTAYLNDKTDLWFGMSISYDFFIPKDAKITTEVNGVEQSKDMIFEFHGDDDVFVYIDDVLVLDLGGTHYARTGTINFTTGAVSYQTGDNEGEVVNTTLGALFNAAGKTTALEGDKFAEYTMHSLDFFYLERGGTYSYSGIRFNMPTIPENSLMVGKDLLKDDDQDIIDAELDYTFRIVDASDTSKSFVEASAPYMVYEGDQYITTNYVDANGYFTLKAGQRALFPSLLDPTNGQKEYYVQEILPDNVDGQYSVVYYDSEDSITTKDPTRISGDGTDIYQTKNYTIDEDSENYTNIVMFFNNVSGKPLDVLNITKVAGDGDTIDTNKKFDIRVQVGNDQGDLIPLPTGTEYVVSKDGNVVETLTVVSDGIIQLGVGETATVKGFLAGTYWVIEEILGEEEHFTPVYNGEALKGTIDEAGNAGTFGVEDEVSFTVTNYPCDFILNVNVEKQAIGNTGNANFNFNVEEGTWTDDDNDGVYVWNTTKSLNSTNVTVQNENTSNGKVTLGFHIAEDSGQLYYRISEQRGDGEYIYDKTYYIVEVSITGEGDEKSAYVSRVWKNGTELLTDMQSALPLAFVNYKTTSFTVDKTVINASNATDTDGVFSFEVTVTLNGQAFTNIPDAENGEYTVDSNGIITFNLEHKESVTIPIPLNATVTVTEANNAGYKTSYQVEQNGEDGTTYSGTTVTVPDIVNGATVHFTNQTGYELPATGGHGTFRFIWCGLLMILAAGGLLFYKGRAKSNN